MISDRGPGSRRQQPCSDQHVCPRLCKPLYRKRRPWRAGLAQICGPDGPSGNLPPGTEIMARHYDDTARAYLAEFRRALPDVSPDDIVDGFSAMVAVMLGLCANTGRRERLLQGGQPKRTQGRLSLERIRTAGRDRMSESHRRLARLFKPGHWRCQARSTIMDKRWPDEITGRIANRPR